MLSNWEIMLTSGTEFSIEQLKINLVGGPQQSYNFPECKTFLILIKTALFPLCSLYFFFFSAAFPCLLAVNTNLHGDTAWHLRSLQHPPKLPALRGWASITSCLAKHCSPSYDFLPLVFNPSSWGAPLLWKASRQSALRLPDYSAVLIFNPVRAIETKPPPHSVGSTYFANNVLKHLHSGWDGYEEVGECYFYSHCM